MAHNHPLLVWDLETSGIYVIVINRRRGLYWFYKREARGRVAPEAERLLNQYRLTAPVNKYFLNHAVT